MDTFVGILFLCDLYMVRNIETGILATNMEDISIHIVLKCLNYLDVFSEIDKFRKVAIYKISVSYVYILIW